MNKKKIGLLLISCVFLFTGCSLYTSADRPKITVIKVHEVHPDGFPNAEATKYFAKIVNEKSNGKIKVDVYTGSQLGEGKVIDEAISAGTIDVNRDSLSNLIPATSLPFLFRDSNHLWKCVEGPLMPLIVEGLAKKDKVLLGGVYDSGSRSFYATKPLSTPIDYQGAKIRVAPANVKEIGGMVELLGATAVNVAYNDLYLAFQTGSVEGAENNVPSYFTSKHFEWATYYILDEHVMMPEVMFISKTTWNQLSADDQKILQASAEESVQYQRMLWAEFTDKTMKDLENKGVKVIRPNKEAFRKATASLYDKFPQYKDVIQKIQAVN